MESVNTKKILCEGKGVFFLNSGVDGPPPPPLGFCFVAILRKDLTLSRWSIACDALYKMR